MTDETKETGVTEESVATDEVTTTEAPVADEATATAAPARKRTRARKPKEEAAAAPVEAPVRYAVIETGGKQHRVKVGDRLTIERLPDESGSDISFDRVLLVTGDGSTRVGTPVVDGASVSARIDKHNRGEKIVVFKFKAKKRYRRRTGHRQPQTHVTITGISG